MSAKLGLTGVDLLVNVPASRKLGLVRQVAGLISAPGAGLTALTKAVGRVLGPTGRIEVLRSKQLPLATVAPGTRPRRVTCSCSRRRRRCTARGCPGRC